MTQKAFWLLPDPLILASGSVTRKAMLAACGIPLEVIKPDIDEAKIAAPLVRQGVAPARIAMALAEAKAAAIASKHPHRLVLAADQTLDLAGTLYMKPPDMEAARRQLASLNGREHALHAAAVLQTGDIVHSVMVDTATLEMRPMSDAFLNRYLAAIGPVALETVGGYQIEGLGIQLFEQVRGAHPTILGLPLLQVLGCLRTLHAMVD